MDYRERYAKMFNTYRHNVGYYLELDHVCQEQARARFAFSQKDE